MGTGSSSRIGNGAANQLARLGSFCLVAEPFCELSASHFRSQVVPPMSVNGKKSPFTGLSPVVSVKLIRQYCDAGCKIGLTYAAKNVRN